MGSLVVVLFLFIILKKKMHKNTKVNQENAFKFSKFRAIE